MKESQNSARYENAFMLHVNHYQQCQLFLPVSVLQQFMLQKIHMLPKVYVTVFLYGEFLARTPGTYAPVRPGIWP